MLAVSAYARKSNCFSSKNKKIQAAQKMGFWADTSHAIMLGNRGYASREDDGFCSESE